jgi:hypothetical protein
VPATFPAKVPATSRNYWAESRGPPASMMSTTEKGASHLSEEGASHFSRHPVRPPILSASGHQPFTSEQGAARGCQKALIQGRASRVECDSNLLSDRVGGRNSAGVFPSGWQVRRERRRRHSEDVAILVEQRRHWIGASWIGGVQRPDVDELKVRRQADGVQGLFEMRAHDDGVRAAFARQEHQAVHRP